MTTVDGVAHPGLATARPEEVLRQQAAAAVTRGYQWVDQALPAAPAAGALVPALVVAVSLYTAGRYQDCLARTGMVLQAIAALRTAQPDLPEL